MSQRTGTTSDLGTMLRNWRLKRHRSQLDLALDSGVSARHLSFIETGRSRPSPDVILAIADQLQIPLRTQNALLEAGGYAPRFSETPLGAPNLQSVRDALSRLLRAHDPYPGVALDKNWNVVLANTSAQRMVSMLPEFLRAPTLNMFRASLHPEGFAALTANFAAWGSYLIDELEKLVAASADAELAALLADVQTYPNVIALRHRPKRETAPSLLIPCVLIVGGQQWSMFTTLATLGSPRDITLAELTVELFYPADEATASALRGQ